VHQHRAEYKPSLNNNLKPLDGLAYKDMEEPLEK